MSHLGQGLKVLPSGPWNMAQYPQETGGITEQHSLKTTQSTRALRGKFPAQGHTARTETPSTTLRRPCCPKAGMEVPVYKEAAPGPHPRDSLHSDRGSVPCGPCSHPGCEVSGRQCNQFKNKHHKRAPDEGWRS